MKNKISVAAILISLMLLNVVSYADSDFDKAMLKAKKSLRDAMDKSDETKIIKARGQFERILQLKKDVWLVNYYIALSDYGLATTGMGSNDNEKVKKYTQSGIEILNKSIDENPEFADSYILLETLNFNRWQYEQDKMQDIISATQSADAEAKKLEPDNPRLSLINGIASFYTPEAFGGGAAIAIPLLEKSIAQFKTRKEKKDIYPDWGQDLAIGYMAMSLIKRNDDGDMVKAKEYIDNGMKSYPNSGFLSGYVMKEYKDNSK